MQRIFIVVSLPGTGKSSIIESARLDRRYQLINCGDVMGEIGIKRRHVKDKDDLRKLAKKKYSDDIDYVFEKVSKMDGDIIFSTHVSGESKGRFLPSMSDENTKKFKNIVGIMYIDAPTSQISQRRKADKTRKRAIETDAMISRHKALTLSTLVEYTSYLNIPLYIINNEDGQLRDAIRLFIRDVSDAFGEIE